MAWRLPALGVIGVIALAVGVYLAFANRSWLHPAFVIVAGAVALTVLVMAVLGGSRG